MKVLLIDDERLALANMQRMLGEYADIDIVGSFTSSVEAVDALNKLQPDVIFLDIHMPQMNGLQAAVKISEIWPKVELVFITAHNDYALDAFDRHALDYIMKPLNRERLRKTIERLRRIHKPSLSEKQQQTADGIVVHCMKTLQIQLPGKKPESLKWRTAKVKELFAYLFQHQGQAVSKNNLLELLWPEVEERKGITNLQTSIYRIRKMWEEIGEGYFTLLYSTYGYVLETRQVSTDVKEWEDKLHKLTPLIEHNAAEHRIVIDQYVGDYLEAENYIWAEIERQRLKSLWLQHAQNLGKYYDEQGFDNEAMVVYYLIQKQDPFLEDSYLALMKIYERLKDYSAVETQYQHLKQMLMKEFGTTPRKEITDWYNNWNYRNAVEM